MKILITGANGFIGRELCKKLTSSKNIVVGIGRQKTTIDNVIYEPIDILDRTSLENLFIKYQFDVVYHLASITFHDEIVNKKEKTLEVSLKGTENLVCLFNKYCSNAKFVYTSTGKVYGGQHDDAISENTSIAPSNILGKSKYLTEQIIDYYASDNETNQFTILRVFNVYGQAQRSTFVVPHIIKHIKENNVIPLGNLDDKRDYIYISDVIDALVAILKDSLIPYHLDRFNIATKNCNSVRDILNILEKILNIKIPISTVKDRQRIDEYSVEIGDYAKFKAYYNWEPKVSLKEGLFDILTKENLL